jgi:cyclopropane fatty-acyl-phospholipid synthase-like methyltransferase
MNVHSARPCPLIVLHRYSCPWWGEAEGGISGDLDPALGVKAGDLEAAQMRKLHNVIEKARIREGHRVLEFGSGWGGFCIEVIHATHSFILHAVS